MTEKEIQFAAILDHIMSTPENFNPNVFRDIMIDPEPLVYTYVQKNFPELLEEETGDPGGDSITPAPGSISVERPG